ncbi:MAG: hypothetical protein WAZ31_11575, partial [Rectinemataceae bacterium]
AIGQTADKHGRPMGRPFSYPGDILTTEAFSKVGKLLKKLPEFAAFAYVFVETRANASQFQK